MRASPADAPASFTHVSGSIGGTRLILNVRRMALKPHSGSLADSNEPSSAMELPVIRRPPSFHVTQGPSFGNLDPHDLDLNEDDDDDNGFISPVDYGGYAADSGVHLTGTEPDDRWAAVSGRQDGVGKMLNALRSRP